jgi:hypothetical protein
MMTTMPQRSWPTWPYRVFLVVLFFGPPTAALFIATGLPIMTDLGWLARNLLSTYVCPTPAKSYELLGAPMAVCTRCWGATIGLWLAWFGVQWGQRQQSLPRWFNWHWALRLVTAAIPFGLWWLEIHYWPTASYEVLLLNGAIAGSTAGLFFCSLWPGLVITSSQQ